MRIERPMSEDIQRLGLLKNGKMVLVIRVKCLVVTDRKFCRFSSEVMAMPD